MYKPADCCLLCFGNYLVLLLDQQDNNNRVILTRCRAGWFMTDAYRLAGIFEQHLREVVITEFLVDLLRHAVYVASHLQNKYDIRAMV